MKPIWKNTLAVIAGFVAANVVNMCIIMASGLVIAPPEGADMTTAEGMRAAMSHMEPKHFLMPFLAHALGTLVGGYFAALIATNHKQLLALVIGGIFLAIGVLMVTLIGGPVWFITCDLVLAYVPMAWLGGKLASKRAVESSSKLALTTE